MVQKTNVIKKWHTFPIVHLCIFVFLAYLSVDFCFACLLVLLLPDIDDVQ